MYWSESWKDTSVETLSANDVDESASNSGNSEALLDKIIDGTNASVPRKRLIRIKFPTPAYETRFKSCLAQVRVDARIVGEGRKRALLLRPHNIRYFDDLVRTSGLINCASAMQAVNFLKMNADGFLRFEAS